MQTTARMQTISNAFGGRTVKKAPAKGNVTKTKGGLGKRSSGKSKMYTPDVDSGFFVQPKGDALWYPWAERPSWLDGSLPGDRGFDPFGLSKPAEYLLIDFDELDQNLDKNVAGRVIGRVVPEKEKVSTNSLSPYAEVFGLQRFRECELIHGRWCMLAVVGILAAELQTGVSWVDAGKVELEQAQYANKNLPFDITSLVIIEVLAVGGAEIYRNTELDLEKRLYPGGPFDPLNLGSDPDTLFNLQTAEIKHARLAMVAMFILGVNGLYYGKGPFA
mmetsp:Transcript_23269/g.75772  ORF Transcript_23269/g.75772 Transcript_23269/m.75772 type:complete len:275 (+) Transcript_23269:14-838(+)